MAYIEKQKESYSSSVSVSGWVKVPVDAQSVLVRNCTSPAPDEAGSFREIQIVGPAIGIRVSDLEAENTGSISRCTMYPGQHASSNFDFMISRVLGLLHEEDEVEDDYGAVVPTRIALRNSLEILSEAFRELQTIFPLAAATVSFDGGIRIQWMRPNSSLRLVLPGNEEEEAYIYYEYENEYGTEPASAQNLTKRIRWLQRECTYVESISLW